jgi:hydrogenase maturation protein HypF
MKLEAAAVGSANEFVELPVDVEESGRILTLKTSQMVRTLLELRDDFSRSRLAYSFQKALAEGLAETALITANNHGLKMIGFTGGVAYNEMITKVIRDRVENAGLKFLRHQLVPPGDGGISLGQAAVASFKGL